VRTTLTLDDDVLAVARERARREGRSIGEVVSELARQALAGSPAAHTEQAFFGFEPLPPRGRPVTNTLIDALREDGPE
jgi:hypothetical protein